MSLPKVRLTATLFAVCLLVTRAHADIIQLDPPSVAAGSNASSIIDVSVTAGASGAPNGFSIQWMTRAAFDLLGDWPTDPTDPNLHSAIFLGTPTLNTVDGTRTFLLTSGQVANVQLGDIFDETGVLSDHREEMASGTEYVFRVKANGDGAYSTGGGLLPESPYSATVSAFTKAHDDLDDCVHSQGYWKNHPGKWPVNSLKVGSIIYTKTQLLLIMDQPANGNGLVSLAHQLIAAKLNILAGAVAPAVITNAVNAADAMVSTRVIPPIGSGFLDPGVTSNLNDVLEQFNTDEKSHTCTTPTPTRPHTWGELKAMYR